MQTTITVSETSDPVYARACFDGTDREWTELIADSPTTFYIVSYGLAGCYMADGVSVFADKDSAMSYAKGTLEFWKDEDAADED